MNVDSFMTRKVITVVVNQSMLDASKTMKQHGIKHLPVLDPGGRLVGVVTDRDIKRASASDATSLEIHELLYLLDKLTIQAVMTKKPTTIAPADSDQAAAELMVTQKIGCLPVVEDGKLVGIVTKDDLLRLVASGNR